MTSGDPHRGLWLVALWSSTLPAIGLAILVRRVVERSHPDVATFVALALAFGTVLLPFSAWLFGHTLGALTVMGAWALLRPPATSTCAVLLAGLLLGVAIGVEYNLAIVALVFLVAVALTRRLAHVVALSVGTVIATIPAMVYGWLVFENPFEVSYQGHLPNFQGDGALGVYNLTAPKPDEIRSALIGTEGLLTLTPIMLFALAGAVMSIRAGGLHRRDAWVALASLGLMLLVSTGIDGLGGDTPGPRYLVPVIPLFAVPLAHAWRRFPVPCAVASLVGAAFMLMATVTLPRADPPNWARALSEGTFAPNVFTGQESSWIALIGVAVGAVAVSSSSGPSSTQGRDAANHVTAIGVGVTHERPQRFCPALATMRPARGSRAAQGRRSIRRHISSGDDIPAGEATGLSSPSANRNPAWRRPTAC